MSIFGLPLILFKIPGESTWYTDGTTITIGGETILVTEISADNMDLPTKRVNQNGLVGNVTSISDDIMDFPIKIVDKDGFVGDIVE